MKRRHFLTQLAATAGLAGVSTAGWIRDAFAQVVPGAGPYGSLGSPNALGIALPPGFSVRLIGRTGMSVGAGGYVWHPDPDGGGCFAVAGGGWVYVSNSEVERVGGVGAIKFDAAGNIVDSYRILSNGDRPCSGGATPWGTWLSCEEVGGGRVWECDPQRASQGILRPGLGTFSHETAAVDPKSGYVYLTEDDPNGRLYRFRPAVAGDLSAGSLQAAFVAGGVVSWVTTSASKPDRQLTTTAFNGGEGARVFGDSLYFSTKGDDRIWELNLRTKALSVLFDFSMTPNSPLSGVDALTFSPFGDLFVAEDGGNMEVCMIGLVDGIRQVAPFLRLDGHPGSEITGLAFNPAGTKLYFSSQRATPGVGMTYEVSGPFRTAIVTPTQEKIIQRGATWKYRPSGSTGQGWRTAGYDDTTWASGPAPFGYGDPVATVISTAAADGTREITSRYRRSFQISHGYASITLSLRRDDGAIVWINNGEVLRTNLPSGNLTPTSLAVTTIAAADELAYSKFTIKPTLLRGTNVITVEIHQSSATSGDCSFDLELTGYGNTGPL